MGLQFGIKEVYNCTILDFATNKPFAYVDYAEATTNETSSQRTPVVGGQGAYKLMSFDSQKESTFQLTLPLVDIKLLAMLAGDELVEGATDVYKREELTVVDNAGSLEITLSETPLADTLIVNEIAGLRDYGAEITATVAGTTATLTGVAEGDKVVAFYQYSSPTTSKKFSIAANKFPKTVKIIGDGLWRDQETQTDKAVKMTVHSATPQGNFTITTSSADVTVLDITFDLNAVKDASGDLSYIEYVVL